MLHHVFLSYSHKDIEVMRRVRDDLRRHELAVWTDENLTPGTESWKNAIEHALQNTASLVVILSPDAKESIWVEREMDYARVCNVPIIPLLARGDDERSAVPFELINVQRADIRQDYAAGMQSLLAAVDMIVAAQPIEKPKLAYSLGAPGGHALPHSSDMIDPWNISHQMKLLRWLCLDPGRLAASMERYGAEPAQRAGAWLVSALGWLPFLLPILGYSLGTVEISGKRPLALLFTYVLFLIGWLASAWLGSGDRRSGMVALVVSGITAFMIFLLLNGVSEIAFIDTNDIRGTLGVIIIGISIGIAAGIAFAITINATGILVGIVVAAMGFSVIGRIFLGSPGALAGLVMVGLAFFTSGILQNGLEQRRASRLHYVLAALLILTYALTVWLYLLGGWQVLAPR